VCVAFEQGCPFLQIDGGVGDHDIGEGPVCEVELRGGFLVASFLHPQQYPVIGDVQS
jgi:hypothetical protein